MSAAPLALAGAMVVGLAALACGFGALCWGVTLAALLRRPPPLPARWPPIAVLRPCEGDERGLLARLDSTLSAGYPGPLQLVVACGGALERLGPLRLDPRVRLVQSTVPPGALNRKAVHLEAARASLTEAAEVVLSIDDDVQVSLPLLCGLVRAALRPGNSAAFAPPLQRGRPLASVLGVAALGSGPHAFATLAGLARLGGQTPALVGCAVAIRANALRAVGGFAQGTHFIGDDLALGSALGRVGQLEATRAIADCRDSALGLAGLLRQLARWIRVARAHQPWVLVSYPLLISPFPLLLALGWLTRASALVPWLAVLYGVRVALALTLRAGWTGGPLWAPLDPLLADCAWISAWLLAAWPGALRWRGRSYALGRGGALGDGQK